MLKERAIAQWKQKNLKNKRKMMMILTNKIAQMNLIVMSLRLTWMEITLITCIKIFSRIKIQHKRIEMHKPLEDNTMI